MAETTPQDAYVPDYPNITHADGPYVVTRDGAPVSDVLATINDAMAWLLRHQSASASHALTHEGYAVVPAPVVNHSTYVDESTGAPGTPADIAFQAVCSCGWQSRWIHADEYDNAQWDATDRAHDHASNLASDHVNGRA